MTALIRFLQIIFFSQILLATPGIAEVFPRNNYDSVQDQARILSPETKTELRAMIARQSATVRVVIVQNRTNYGGKGSFVDYADALANSWRINTRPFALLIVHEIHANQIAVRLGKEYNKQDQKIANDIIRDVYRPALADQKYDMAHTNGLKSLVDALLNGQPEPVPYNLPEIALKDTGHIIQDHVGTFVPGTIGELTAQLKKRAGISQMVRLVVIQRHVDINPDIGLERFAAALFRQWGMADKPDSVLVLFEVESNKLVLRLDGRFGRNIRLKAIGVVQKTYQPLLDQHKFSQAHHEGMLELVSVLTNRSSNSAIPTVTQPISSQRSGEHIRDTAGILNTVARNQLSAKLEETGVPPVLILTIQNHRPVSNGSDFTTYAKTVFDQWGMMADPKSILIAHNVETKHITAVFGSAYSEADKGRLRAALQNAAAPALRQNLYNAAHIAGLDALLKTLDRKPPQIVNAPNSGQENLPAKFSDNGVSLRDLVGVIGPQAAKNLRSQFAIRRQQGQEIRLVIVDDYSALTSKQTLLLFANELFQDWGLANKPYSILVLHDVSRNRLIMRLGPRFGQAAVNRAKSVFKYSYRPNAAKDRAVPSHSTGMSKLLAALPAPDAAKPMQTDPAKDQKPPVLSAPDVDHPWAFPLALLFIISIVAMGAFQSYRKSSKPRRERAARISAWKRMQDGLRKNS